MIWFFTEIIVIYDAKLATACSVHLFILNTFFDINIIINSDIAILIHIPFSPKAFAIITNTIGKINIDLIAHIIFEYFGTSIA